MDIDGRTFRSISPISMYTGLMIACRVDVTTNVRRCRTHIIYFEHKVLTFCNSCCFIFCSNYFEFLCIILWYNLLNILWTLYLCWIYLYSILTICFYFISRCFITIILGHQNTLHHLISKLPSILSPLIMSITLSWMGSIILYSLRST